MGMGLARAGVRGPALAAEGSPEDQGGAPVCFFHLPPDMSNVVAGGHHLCTSRLRHPCRTRMAA